MTDLDLTRYEGHTPGPWSAVEWTDETPYPAGAMVAVQRGDTHDGKGRVCEMIGQGNGRYEPEVTAANARLIADAPLLLAEVRRLREALKVQREMHDVCLELHPESESCLEAEEKLTSLRQSHARLLAAAKQVDNWIVPRCICSPGAKCLGCKLRAAVAEAEALNAE